MARYISARNGQVHIGQDTFWQHHSHIPARKWSGTSRPGMARYISARNGQVHLGQPHSFFPSYSILNISASCFTSFTTRLGGAGVGVWPGTSRPNKTKMAGITPAQVWDIFVVAQSLGYLLFTFSPTQHRGPNKCDGRIYPGPFWPSTSRPKGVADRTCDYGAEVQRSSAQSKPKRKELIFDEVQTGKPQKRKDRHFKVSQPGSHGLAHHESGSKWVNPTRLTF